MVLQVKELGQAVCKHAQDCVHKAAHLSTMSKDVKMREMLGEATPLFLPKASIAPVSMTTTSTASIGDGGDTGIKTPTSVVELEANMLLLINQWLKHLSL